MAFGPAVRVPSDASAARWIAPTLGTFGTVGGVVPGGYEQYLLLDFRGDEPLGWDGVSRLFERLGPVLEAHTESASACWFGVWEGYGFDTAQTMLAAVPGDDDERRALDRERQRLRDDDARRNRAIRQALRDLPAFDLPHRRYFLLHGAVRAAGEIRRPGERFAQPPDLWWPDDRRWFVGGDTDLDWCYVAGSGALAAAVAATFPSRTRAADWTASNASAGS